MFRIIKELYYKQSPYESLLDSVLITASILMIIIFGLIALSAIDFSTSFYYLPCLFIFIILLYFVLKYSHAHLRRTVKLIVLVDLIVSLAALLVII